KLCNATFAEIISVLEEGAMEISRREFVTAAVSATAVAAVPASAMSQEAPAKKGDPMPTTLTPYLLFDGTCQQAMEFYKSCFGGELTVMKVKDSPMKDHMPAVQQEKTLNAKLTKGNLEISASDWLMPNRTPQPGNTVCLYLSGGTFQELKTLFDKLSDSAQVTDPLKQMFFGTYGALNDKFGVRWMFQTNDKG
ncbi:MAG TPA: VOC family protein, partial [Terriglobales bacterium]